MVNRLEVRLDPERRSKLDELARDHQVSISDLVRELLDREYEAWLKAQRVRAARTLSALSTEEMPEPEVLSEQLAQTYQASLC